MSSKQIIYYETLHWKINLKKRVLQNDFDMINIKDNIDLKNIERKKSYCVGSDQYIKSFIEHIKEKVIKKLPNLNEVKIMIGIFDKNNIWHNILITTLKMLSSILKIDRIFKFHKSIFVVITYGNETVFVGNLNFNGIQ